MISETDLNLYSFTSTATIFGPNKSVICIFAYYREGDR